MNLRQVRTTSAVRRAKLLLLPLLVLLLMLLMLRRGARYFEWWRGPGSQAGEGQRRGQAAAGGDGKHRRKAGQYRTPYTNLVPVITSPRSRRCTAGAGGHGGRAQLLKHAGVLPQHSLFLGKQALEPVDFSDSSPTIVRYPCKTRDCSGAEFGGCVPVNCSLANITKGHGNITKGHGFLLNK
jgi:hypothetical protein